MANWFQRLLQPADHRIRLEFELEMDAGDRHVVRVYRRADGQRQLITDLRPFFAYGYREEADEGRRVQVLSEADWQTLQSLRSLNPELRAGGELAFEVAPPVLRYLRTKDTVQEGSRSQELKVIDQPAQPAANVDFDPETGFHVQTGLLEPGSATVVPLSQVHKTPDGGYLRVGKSFLLPPALSPAADSLLQAGTRRVAVADIPEFFLRDLVLIKTEFNAVLTDLAQQVRVIRDPLLPSVQVHKDPQGWLSFTIQYQAAGFSLPHDLLARRKDAYHRLDPNTWLAVDRKAVAKVEGELRKLEAVPVPGGYRLPATAFASLEEFIQQTGGRAELSAAYRQFLDQLTNFHGDESFLLPPDAEEDLSRQRISLRPYQRSGIHWLRWLSENGLHGVLADSMGLGKTLQAICALRMGYQVSGSLGHSLVLAPKSVLPHWQREFKRYYPQATTYLYHGPERDRSLLLADRPIIFISTYATAANDLAQLANVPFFYVILDEATYIKNRDAVRSQAVKALNSVHRLALSGTPVENRPAELWSVFDFLMRGHLGQYGAFTRIFETAILAGDPKAAERLGRRVRPFLLRRLKEDVAKDLPGKIELDEWCELTAEQRQLYGGLQDEVNRIREAIRRGERLNYTANILPTLTKLKQICDHPALVTARKRPLAGRSEKFDWIVEKVAEICAGGEQVLVFSHFLGMLNLLQADLEARGLTYIRIDGSTTDRQGLIDRFNQGKASVGLLSLLAAGHGINLTAANHVIHADRWWNPAVEDQATDRVHRIGQSRTVYVYRILTQGTLEERIDRMLETKRGMADQIISAARGGLGGWTRAELLEILRPLD